MMVEGARGPAAILRGAAEGIFGNGILGMARAPSKNVVINGSHQL